MCERPERRPLALALLIVGLASASPLALADQAPIPTTKEALDQEYAKLAWHGEAADYPLATSKSKIHLPAGLQILTGPDAARYVFLNNGIEFPGTEAVLFDPESNAEVDFDYTDDGYIADQDWSDIDPDEFLKSMQEGARESNDERIRNGKSAIEVVGWLQKPTYDAATHTASYALELSDQDGHWVNAVSLRLGRGGHHEVTWIGPIDTFKSAAGPKLLNTALAAHEYDPGNRYADFKQGDKVASYGVAGLVAAALGIKFGKGLIAAAIAFLAIAGKKVAIIAVPVIAVAGAKIKRMFGRNT